jgi:hypothetical protein
VQLTDRFPLSPPYQRHQPEQTLLYQIIERHYPEFRDMMVIRGKSLPLHVVAQELHNDHRHTTRQQKGRLSGGFWQMETGEPDKK